MNASLQAQGAQVVVADDCADAADALALMLESLGYDVIAAYDGVQAVEACTAARPSLAILDVEMPNMDGFEAAVRIKAGQAPVPWITSLSGAALDREPWKSRDSAFDSSLKKPADPNEIVELVEAIAGPPNRR